MENLTELQLQANDIACELAAKASSSPVSGMVSQLVRMPMMRWLHLNSNPKLCGCLSPNSTEECENPGLVGHQQDSGVGANTMVAVQMGGTQISRTCDRFHEIHSE